jgi:nitrogen fixation NifU-like protein
MNLSKEMYTELILDHYNNPKNFGSLENPDIKFKDTNPSCGDIIEIHAKIKDNKIHNIKFTGKGCAISQATAEILTGHIKGKTLNEVSNLTKAEVLSLIGISLSPIRLKCALLSLKVLKCGVCLYLGENLDNEEYYG